MRSTPILSSFFCAAIVALVVACGSTSSSPDSDAAVASLDAGSVDALVRDSAASGDARVSDANSDAPDLSGTYPCEGTTCQAGEYCIHPCGGGALRECIPVTDAGTCPPFAITGQCVGDGGPTFTGCVSPPPPAFCSSNPACPSGMSTQPVEGRNVGCLCA
jgi:hypothetical protein